jgi:hypothetical protein
MKWLRFIFARLSSRSLTIWGIVASLFGAILNVLFWSYSETDEWFRFAAISASLIGIGSLVASPILLFRSFGSGRVIAMAVGSTMLCGLATLVTASLLFHIFDEDPRFSLVEGFLLVASAVAFVVVVHHFPALGDAIERTVYRVIAFPFLIVFWGLLIASGMACFAAPAVLLAKLVVLIGWNYWPHWPGWGGADVLLWGIGFTVGGLVCSAVLANIRAELFP